MTRSTSLALCSAVALPETDGAPEWIHLLPAGPIRTVDGRGPYALNSTMQEIADASLKPGQKLPLDENHATDKAAPRGEPSPARGWIVELQARDDGLWGKVDWNASGQALMQDRAYRGVSPAILLSKSNKILGVVRASLTNTPNLEGLTALHSEESGMDYKSKLLERLGLDSSADDAAIETALAAKPAVSLQAQDLLEHPAVIALQAQNTELAETVKALVDGQAKRDAEAYIDGAIAKGRVGLKPVRDEYIALHMTDPDKVKKLVEAMPAISGRTNTGDAPPANGETVLTADDRKVMALFGVDEETYKAELAKTGLSMETL